MNRHVENAAIVVVLLSIVVWAFVLEPDTRPRPVTTAQHGDTCTAPTVK